MRPSNDLGTDRLIPSSVLPETPTDLILLAYSRFERTGYAVLRRVRCEVRDGLLRLSGCLPSHYLKQVAQEAVAAVEGVSAVVNDIEVVRPPARCETAERFARDE
jgi:osmotically-inducible protein OsmY